MNKLLLVLLCVFLFASCDCRRYTYGYVADFETKEVIKGAEVYSFASLDGKKRDEHFRYTDTTGWFETAFSLKGIAKCGVLKIVVSKDGYQTAHEVNWELGDTLFLFRTPQ